MLPIQFVNNRSLYGDLLQQQKRKEYEVKKQL